ncbi:hypothetical protein ABL78_8153 [Leptomonas seymouri]|uniref:PNPLA domain-containing protein n=1 Tax=Leptomonas seymouri TaxID=5684 RepID=A0A0N1P9M9_LEPSE|nr:hypothetical protein ABL78_8153 [Leptomonas seymouri]|eukprot:KPI82833.1 hypothetical protein ABL78_8153 [Leptomonas seymouri]
MHSTIDMLWVRCLTISQQCSYVLYALYTCASFLWEVVTEVLEIPTGAPQYDALLRQASCASSYEEWLPLASTLDDLDGFQQWRTNEQSSYFSFEGVMRTIEELLSLSSTGNAETLLEGLHKRVRSSLCGISHHRLYEYRTGTKTVIHSYTSLVCFLLSSTAEAARHNPRLLPRTREVLSEIHQVYGSTALLLQGGILAASAHFGVAKALYEAGLLPPVIYGSGSGAVVATLICCSTDLPGLFGRWHEDHASALLGGKGSGGVSSSRWEWWRRLLCSGEVVDPATLADFLQRTVGDVTFSEAYARTGRVLNIPYTSAPSPLLKSCGHNVVDHQLLNYLTAPDVVVRSAVRCAMCVLPTSALSPASPPDKAEAAAPRGLLARMRQTRSIVVYDPPVVRQSYPNPCGEHTGCSARDPVQRMRGLFSIRFSIVSDASLRGYMWRQLHYRSSTSPALRQRLRIWTCLQYVCVLCFLGVVHVLLQVLAWLGYEAFDAPPHFSLSAMLQQDEGESMLIYPVSDLQAYLRLVFNPNAENMAALQMDAQREVWPRLEQLRMSMSVEQVLTAALKRFPLKTAQ